MTQQQVAAAIGAKNIQDVSNAENPAQKSRFGTRQRILDYFGRQASEVYLVEPKD